MVSVMLTVVMAGQGIVTSMVTVFAPIGVLSSFVYLLQIVVQIKVYGWRKWFEYGLGTGIDVYELREKMRADE